MIVQAKIHLFIPCVCCKDGRWQADQLPIGVQTTWTCDSCHNQSRIMRVSSGDFDVLPTGKKETPITVTLRSITDPRITLKLNTWKYAHSQDQTKEEFEDNQRYFYNEHTCPTNWVREIEQIEFQGDTDPHGVFEFVSVEDGHFKDPSTV